MPALQPPRVVLFDYLQDFKFWLFDVAPIEALSLPLFSPLMGFSSISAPSFTTEVKEIKEANWYFARKVLLNATTEAMTLQKGSLFFNHDFYRWAMAGLTGDTGGVAFGASSSFSGVGSVGGPTPRRTLVLVQFFPRSPFQAPYIESNRPHTSFDDETINPKTIAAALGGITTLTGLASGVAGNGVTSTITATAKNLGGVGAAQASIGPFEVTPMIPAKAWVLYGCVPTGYKPTSEFSGASSEISLNELTMEYEGFEELSLGGDPPV